MVAHDPALTGFDARLRQLLIFLALLGSAHTHLRLGVQLWLSRSQYCRPEFRVRGQSTPAESESVIRQSWKVYDT
jgi:hypothetical protein